MFSVLLPIWLTPYWDVDFSVLPLTHEADLVEGSLLDFLQQESCLLGVALEAHDVLPLNLLPSWSAASGAPGHIRLAEAGQVLTIAALGFNHLGLRCQRTHI